MTIALLVSGGLIGLILALVLGDNIPAFEHRFMDWFSRASGKPRWFMLWFLVLFLWIPGRYVLKFYFKWFNDDVDFILATVLWSVIPFMVENVLKASNAAQMQMQTAMLERSAQREEAMIALANKILDAVEDGDCKGGE